ncbi:MAG: serine acetyltransferase [Desulfobacterales bacterium]|jgi:serine O-acetyltransferase
MDDKLKLMKDACTREAEKLSCYREQLPRIAEDIIHICDDVKCFTHVEYDPIPSRDSVVAIIDKFRQIVFPGYFSPEKLDPVNLRYSLGQAVSQLFDMLSRQVTLSISHDCYRYNKPCQRGTERGYEVALKVLSAIPTIRKTLADDVQACFDGDPAAKSFDEIIFSYPGMYALTVYRLAHQLYELQVPLLPRIMTEQAHSLTGIDIHPGARIGSRFVIDHGTGVVIGETTEIGENVRIYQGVTLGALSLPREMVNTLRYKKRHPTIEDNVIIYSGATILGGDTVIGANSTIGGSVWLTESIPPNTRVMLETPKLVFNKETP